MKMIKDLVDQIDDELCGAKRYAEMYVDYKVNGDNTWASRFREMATDELKHATYIHELATNKIQRLNQFAPPPVEMQEIWDKSHMLYVEKEAWIKQMLNM